MTTTKISLRLRLPVILVICAGLAGVAPTASAEQVYALSGDGVMRLLADPDCVPSTCEWVDIDRNRQSISLAATREHLFQLHENGSIWVWTGRACDGPRCPHWRRIDNNPAAIAIAANDNSLYQLHDNGSIWRWKGQPCDGARCRSWERLDRNPRAVAISAAGSKLFQLHDNGSIWESTGVACTGSSCPGWRRLDGNPSSTQIAAAAPGQLYQRHDNGSIWHWKGRPCEGGRCASWDRLDRNPATQSITTAPGQLFQLHDNGSIWQWGGAACHGDACRSWKMLDRNPRTRAIAAGQAATPSDLDPSPSPSTPPLYQVHENGAVWRWKGRPCDGGSCPHWDNITAGGAFTSYSSTRGGIYVFDGDYYSGSVASALPPSAFGFDTMRFARTGSNTVEMNILLLMASYANTAFEDSQTQEFYINKFFGPQRVMESYFNANSRNIQFKFNLVGVEQVVDSRTQNCAHRWGTCSTGTDGAPPWMATVEHLEMLPAASRERISEYDRNNDDVIAADELFVLKIEGMEDAGVIAPFDDNCGLNRSLPRAVSLPDGKQIAAGTVYLPIADETNLVTTVHEIAHLFGARDLYGSGNNFRSSLMGPTCFDGEEHYQLDPWHKMRMGLVAPRIIPIPRATTEKESIRLTLPVNKADYEPVLFYNPDRPTEYFMMEYRRRGAGGYDSDVHSTGLMIWHVATNASFVPLDYSNPPFGGSPGQSVATVGAPGQTLGRARAWRADDGVVALNWPGRGDSGLRVRVADQNDYFLTFEWWRN